MKRLDSRFHGNDKIVYIPTFYGGIKIAIFQYHLDKNMGFYKAMESMLQELSDLKAESTKSKKTQKGLFLGILIGIIVTVLGGLLLHMIIKTYF